jgi:hypothetical protein
MSDPAAPPLPPPTEIVSCDVAQDGTPEPPVAGGDPGVGTATGGEAPVAAGPGDGATVDEAVTGDDSCGDTPPAFALPAAPLQPARATMINIAEPTLSLRMCSPSVEPAGRGALVVMDAQRPLVVARPTPHRAEHRPRRCNEPVGGFPIAAGRTPALGGQAREGACARAVAHAARPAVSKNRSIPSGGTPAFSGWVGAPAGFGEPSAVVVLQVVVVVMVLVAE